MRLKPDLKLEGESLVSMNHQTCLMTKEQVGGKTFSKSQPENHQFFENGWSRRQASMQPNLLIIDHVFDMAVGVSTFG